MSQQSNHRLYNLVHRLTPGRSGRRTTRIFLLVVIPALVIVGAGGLYLLGGRWVETENAYVHADKVAVTPEVKGHITRVAVDENETVRKGDLLFRIDPKRYRIAVAHAESGLAQARSEIKTIKAKYRETAQELTVVRSNAEFAEREYQRQARLAKRQAISDSVLDRYRHERTVAKERVAKVKQSLARLRAELDGDPDIPVEEHSRYREAETTLRAAQTDLETTQVLAPFAGITAKTPVQGDFVSPGNPAMSLVANNGLWVEANLKETQLTHVHNGQPVDITLDVYPDVTWQGHVTSVAAATGSEFSVLPAENATGNWVKVVQRVPVRIAIDNGPNALTLRSGLSAGVSVDTGWHDRAPRFLQPVATWVRATVGTARAAEQP